MRFSLLDNARNRKSSLVIDRVPSASSVLFVLVWGAVRSSRACLAIFWDPQRPGGLVSLHGESCEAPQDAGLCESCVPKHTSTLMNTGNTLDPFSHQGAQ